MAIGVSGSRSTATAGANEAAPRKAPAKRSTVTKGFKPYPAEMPPVAEGRDAQVEQIRQEMRDQLARITEILREAKAKKSRNSWCMGGYRDFMREANLPEPVEAGSRYSSYDRSFTQEPVVLEAVTDDVIQYLTDEGLAFYRKKMWDAWLEQAARIRATLIQYSINGNILTTTVTKVLAKLGLEAPRTVRNVQLTVRSGWNLDEGDAITETGLATAITAALATAGVPDIPGGNRNVTVTINDRISA